MLQPGLARAGTYCPSFMARECRLPVEIATPVQPSFCWRKVCFALPALFLCSHPKAAPKTSKMHLLFT